MPPSDRVRLAGGWILAVYHQGLIKYQELTPEAQAIIMANQAAIVEKYGWPPRDWFKARLAYERAAHQQRAGADISDEILTDLDISTRLQLERHLPPLTTG